MSVCSEQRHEDITPLHLKVVFPIVPIAHNCDTSPRLLGFSRSIALHLKQAIPVKQVRNVLGNARKDPRGIFPDRNRRMGRLHSAVAGKLEQLVWLQVRRMSIFEPIRRVIRDEAPDAG